MSHLTLSCYSEGKKINSLHTSQAPSMKLYANRRKRHGLQQDGALYVMTDFSAVLDHDVQNRLNTAVPCHSNQCVVLASYSPSILTVGNVTKRVQMNDVWHCWSAQGGVLEANSYYHSIVMRHLLKHYTYLDIKQLNIFTDGCAEQYKSRRNAHFIAELAMEQNIIVTHNYAPTASFKTMVDGQGDLVKSPCPTGKDTGKE